MKKSPVTQQELDTALASYCENVNKHPLTPEQARQYAGKCIARSADGTSILACADDYLALDKALQEKGIDPSTVVMSWFPPADATIAF